MTQKSLNEQREQRLKNLDSLVERGFEAYPYAFNASHRAADLQARYKDAAGDDTDEAVTVAGRAMTVRLMGKVTFVTLQDASGTIQAYFQKDALERYNALKKGGHRRLARGHRPRFL